MHLDTPLDSVVTVALESIAFSEIAVYPIPCRSGRLTLEFLPDNRYDFLRTFEAAFYSVDGYRVTNVREVQVMDGRPLRRVVDVSRLGSGIYYAHLRFGEQTKKMKIPIIND